jgi:MFS family permease
VNFYPWVVVAHVFFVIIALGAHGVSAFAMFRARDEPDRARLAAILDLSATSLITAGVTLLIAIVLGIVAAIMGDHFGRLWPWVSIGVLVVVIGAMTPLATTPLGGVRIALGQRGRNDKPTDPPRMPASAEELAAAQARLRPELVAAIGLVGIAVLTWLMELKPF